MICERPGCLGDIKITHGYVATASCKTSTGQCKSCGRRYTIVTMVVCPAEGYGSGAAALAQRIRENGTGVLDADA
jgi:hypothetical protein